MKNEKRFSINIIIMPFTLFLDSANTSSWISETNSIYNCEYYVDLKALVKPQDMNKKYKMIWTIYSTTGASNMNGTQCPRLHVDIGTRYRTQTGLQNSSFIGTLFPQASSGLYRFIQNIPQNPAVYVDGLCDISTIKVVFYTDYGVIMTNPNGNTQNYVITLYFDETGDGL